MKPLFWVGSSHQDLKEFPRPVMAVIGFALLQGQLGAKHVQAKPLHGFGGAGVLEIVEDYDGDTYRAVYTVKFDDGVYVLHAFQKKSKHGVKAPKRDLDLIRQRLQDVQAQHATTASGKRGKHDGAEE